MDEPWRHLEQRLGRGDINDILVHLRGCPACEERLEEFYQEYLEGHSCDVRKRGFKKRDFFFALHKARRLSVPTRSQIETESV